MFFKGCGWVGSFCESAHPRSPNGRMCALNSLLPPFPTNPSSQHRLLVCSASSPSVKKPKNKLVFVPARCASFTFTVTTEESQKTERQVRTVLHNLKIKQTTVHWIEDQIQQVDIFNLGLKEWGLLCRRSPRLSCSRHPKSETKQIPTSHHPVHGSCHSGP